MPMQNFASNRSQKINNVLYYYITQQSDYYINKNLDFKPKNHYDYIMYWNESYTYKYYTKSAHRHPFLFPITPNYLQTTLTAAPRSNTLQ